MPLVKPLVTTGFLAAVAFVGLSVLPQAAEARPSTKSYTCSGLKSFIKSRGAVVMNTKNRFVYRRFVASTRFCPVYERATRFTVPTRSGSCRVLVCEEPIRFLFDD